MEQETISVQKLTHFITDEIFKAIGLSADGWPRKLMAPVVRPPAFRFSELAANFDQRVASLGFKEATRWILPNFVKNIDVSGAEKIPPSGPLLIASNHPGTYDALIIAANLPRDDLKIISSNIPFIGGMPSFKKHIILITKDAHNRMTALRAGLRHLQEGGSLLLFASGGIDPEPAEMRGAKDELENWSPSVEFFLRKVHQSQLLVTIVSGVLSPKFLGHPFIHFRKARRDRQRIAEFLQVIKQMLQPKDLLLSPKVSFAEPMSPIDLHSLMESSGVMQTIIHRAKLLMAEHPVSDRVRISTQD